MPPAALLAIAAGLLGLVVASGRRRSTGGPGGSVIPGVESSDGRDLYPAFRERLSALLGDLHRAGHRPKLRGTWRSPERQAYYKAKGWSKVDKSFHEVTGPNGEREALAADVQDSRWGPDDPKQATFYRHLRDRAKHYGLRTGAEWTTGGTWQGNADIGWDPGHVEPDAGVTISEAHAGERPWS